MADSGRDSGTLLIVEDHEDTRETLRDCLEEFGYTVDTAADGQEGLATVRQKSFDLVITDLNMPRMDGLGMLQAIRNETQGPDLLMLSADGQISRAVDAMRLGAINYLVKPVELDALVTEVRAVMQARRDRATEHNAVDTITVMGHHTRPLPTDPAATLDPRVRGNSAEDDVLPRTIGRYQVLSELGSGGMGTIFKCFDPALARTVAVKVVADDSDHGGRDDLLRRFACEAQAAGMLRHPNIVTVYDYSADPEGPVYLAMEYLAGTSLAAWLAANSVDTVVLGGFSTSGCVRASGVDTLQHGFRPIVVREACADRDPGPHEANLFDLDAKYADVVGLAEALRKLAAVG